MDSRGVSTSADPLERLVDNALATVRSTWLLRDIANDPAGDDPDVAFHVPNFTARYRALVSHKGPEWRRLEAANSQPVADGGSVAGCHTKLAAYLALPVYVILLEAESGPTVARQWGLNADDEVRDLDVAKVSSNWQLVRDKLRTVQKFDGALFEAQLKKEFQRASVPALIDDNEWPTVGQAAQEQGVDDSNISQAVKRGHLKSNGKKGAARRIDPASLIAWSLKRIDRKLTDS